MFQMLNGDELNHGYSSDIAAPVKRADYTNTLPYVTNVCNI